MLVRFTLVLSDNCQINAQARIDDFEIVFSEENDLGDYRIGLNGRDSKFSWLENIQENIALFFGCEKDGVIL